MVTHDELYVLHANVLYSIFTITIIGVCSCHTRSNRNYIEGIIFTLVSALCFGVVGVIDKLGSSQTQNPYIFSVQSTTFALLGAFLFALAYFNRTFVKQVKAISPQSWKYTVLVGVLASGIFTLFRFLGLLQSTGTFSTLSQVIVTSFTAIFASLFLREKLEKSFWILFLLIVAAMYVVSTGTIALVTVKIGDLLILAGTVFLAGANIFGKIAVSRMQPVMLTVGRFLFGTLFLILVNAIFLKQHAPLFAVSVWAVASGMLWAAHILTFNFALKRVGVTLLTSLLMSAPIITMILEFLFLHDTFHSIQIVAAIVAALCGVLMVIPVGNIKKLFRM